MVHNILEQGGFTFVQMKRHTFFQGVFIKTFNHSACIIIALLQWILLGNPSQKSVMANGPMAEYKIIFKINSSFLMFYCAFDKKFNVIYFKSTFIISLYIYSLTHTPTQETVTKRTHILNVTYYNITSKREVKIPDQNKNLLILIVILPVVGLLITIILFILFKKRSKLL